MLENVGLPVAQLVAPFEVIEICIEANPSQSNHDLHISETLQLTIQVGSAVRQLLRQRLIVGRSTANRRGDVDVVELESVQTIGRVWLIGKTSLVQHWKHEFAGCVPGKRAASAVRAMCAGSEPQNQDPSFWIAESWHWLSPILTIAISPAFLARNLFAILHQSRTTGTIHELRVKPNQPTAIFRINSHVSTLQDGLGIRMGVHLKFAAKFPVAASNN